MNNVPIFEYETKEANEPLDKDENRLLRKTEV